VCADFLASHVEHACRHEKIAGGRTVASDEEDCDSDTTVGSEVLGSVSSLTLSGSNKSSSGGGKRIVLAFSQASEAPWACRDGAQSCRTRPRPSGSRPRSSSSSTSSAARSTPGYGACDDVCMCVLHVSVWLCLFPHGHTVTRWQVQLAGHAAGFKVDAENSGWISKHTNTLEKVRVSMDASSRATHRAECAD
jgi:hypothetical protein